MIKSLIMGVLGLDRNVAGRDFKINEKNVKDAQAKSFMIKGHAWNSKHGVLILDIESGDKRSNKHYLLSAYRKGTGEIAIAYPLPSNYSTWHLAAAVELLAQHEGKPISLNGVMVSVHVATPKILGGEGWQMIRKVTQPAFEDIEQAIVREKSGQATSGSVVQEATELSVESEIISEAHSSKTRKNRKSTKEEPETPDNEGSNEHSESSTLGAFGHPIYGLLDSDELRIVEYLNRWPEFRIRELLKIRRENKLVFTDANALEHITGPDKDPNWIWFSGQEHLEDGFIRYKRGKALALESLPGGGKEKFFLTMSYLLHQPLGIILCNGGTTEMQLEGAQVLTVDKTGHTVTGFQQGLAIQLLQKGYIVILDEVNAVNPAYTFIFHDVANGSRKVISNAAKKEIQIHDRAWFGITINKGTKGTYELNEAFADRMSWLVLDRLQDITPVLDSNVQDIQDADKKWVAKLYSGLLEASEQGQIDISAISIRGFIDLAERLAENQPRQKAVQIALLNKLSIQNPRAAQKLEPILMREAC